VGDRKDTENTRQFSLGISFEASAGRKTKGQPADPGSTGKWSLKRCVFFDNFTKLQAKVKHFINRRNPVSVNESEALG